MKKAFLSLAVLVATGAIVSAQTQQRPASPPGSAQTQVSGEYTKDEKGNLTYQGGKWIEVTYSRPIKRGRDLFGSGADYGKTLYAGAPLWRAGANQSTVLKTDVPLVINGTTVPAGEYSLFVELKSPTEWTLIVSSYGAKKTGNDPTPNTLWGAYNYKPDKDVVRAPMTVQQTKMSVDQLTWAFADVTKDSGKLALAWDTTLAFVPFTVGK